MADRWRTIRLLVLKVLIRVVAWRPREILLRWLTVQYTLLIEVKPRSRYSRRRHRYWRR